MDNPPIFYHDSVAHRIAAFLNRYRGSEFTMGQLLAVAQVPLDTLEAHRYPVPDIGTPLSASSRSATQQFSRLMNIKVMVRRNTANDVDPFGGPPRAQWMYSAGEVSLQSCLVMPRSSHVRPGARIGAVI